MRARLPRRAYITRSSQLGSQQLPSAGCVDDGARATIAPARRPRGVCRRGRDVDRDTVQPCVRPARGALAVPLCMAQPRRWHRPQCGLAALLDRLGALRVSACAGTCVEERIQILGWAGFIKVDGTTYNFLGVPSVPNVSFQKSVQKSMTVSAASSVSCAVKVLMYAPSSRPLKAPSS